MLLCSRHIALDHASEALGFLPSPRQLRFDSQGQYAASDRVHLCLNSLDSTLVLSRLSNILSLGLCESNIIAIAPTISPELENCFLQLISIAFDGLDGLRQSGDYLKPLSIDPVDVMSVQIKTGLHLE